MVAVAKTTTSAHRPGLVTWLPLVMLSAAAAWVAAKWPPWVFMWALAISIYMGLKWLTFADSVHPFESTVRRSLGYLLLWPGMDAKSFLSPWQAVQRPTGREWLLAAAKMALGVILIDAAASHVDRHPTIAAWIGMTGVVFMLHFGLFHLLSVIWRQAGVDAPAIMNAPVRAQSLSEFWGRRWNLAFRDCARVHVFRPLVGRLGVPGATLAVFLVSGIVHDAVISVPAGGGFGLPTLYFAIQGISLLIERSRYGQRLSTRKGLRGRLYCATVTLGPIGLLFHPLFLERVVIPMLTTVGRVWD